MPSVQDWLTISQLLSGMASGRNQSQAQNEALGVSAASGVNRDQLERDQFALQAPSTRMGQSLQASRVKNFAPVQAESYASPFHGAPQGAKAIRFAGGVGSPDAQTKQLADDVLTKTLVDQMSGLDKRPIQQPPTIGQSSLADKALGAAGTAASGLSVLDLLGLLPGGGGGNSSVGSFNGGLGHFDSAGNWVVDTPDNGDPSKPGGGLFPVVPEDPRKD